MGTLMSDHFFIAFRDVQRYHETGLTVDFFAIEKAANDFESSYDGYIGLAPHTASNRDKEKSFLFQMKKSGLIDHMIVSFYTNQDRKSSIKFGSWDEEGVKDG